LMPWQGATERRPLSGGRRWRLLATHCLPSALAQSVLAARLSDAEHLQRTLERPVLVVRSLPDAPEV